MVLPHTGCHLACARGTLGHLPQTSRALRSVGGARHTGQVRSLGSQSRDRQRTAGAGERKAGLGINGDSFRFTGQRELWRQTVAAMWPCECAWCPRTARLHTVTALTFCAFCRIKKRGGTEVRTPQTSSPATRVRSPRQQGEVGCELKSVSTCPTGGSRSEALVGVSLAWCGFGEPIPTCPFFRTLQSLAPPTPQRARGRRGTLPTRCCLCQPQPHTA